MERVTALNLLIKVEASGHEGLDWARHSGVSRVSHDRPSQKPGPFLTLTGLSDSALSEEMGGQQTQSLCILSG